MATTKLWTVAELEQAGAPFERWELIDGELIEMSPSGSIASKLGARFVIHLGNYVLPRRLGEVYDAAGGFVPFPGRDLVRAADAAFVRADRLPSEAEQAGFLRLAPDLVVEVISPSDRLPDVLAKVGLWLEAGVRLLWLVDPPAHTVTVYEPGREPRVIGVGDELDGEPVLPGFRLAMADLFA